MSNVQDPAVSHLKLPAVHAMPADMVLPGCMLFFFEALRGCQVLSTLHRLEGLLPAKVLTIIKLKAKLWHPFDPKD